MASPPRASGPATVIKQPKIAGQAVKIQPATQAPGSVAPHPTAELVQTPRLLARYLVDLEQRLGIVSQAALAGVFTGCNLVQGIPVTAGVTKVIAHQLGRNIKGRIVTNLSAEAGVPGIFGMQTFTATGQYVATAAMTMLVGWGAGGGADGGAGGFTGTTNQATGGGGGGGALPQCQLVPTTIGSSYTVTIPAGGTAGTGGAADAGGNPGNDGGSATFGALATFAGGAGGRGGSLSVQANQLLIAGGSSVAGTAYLVSCGSLVITSTYAALALPPSYGGWSGTSINSNIPCAGAGSQQGQTGGNVGGTGAKNTAFGGTGGGGGGAGPNGAGRAGGTGGASSASTGVAGQRTDGTTNTAAQAALATNTGAGGGGGGGGGYGSSTAGGAGGGGSGGDSGQITVYYPSIAQTPIIPASLPTNQSSTQFYAFTPLITGTIDILFF